MSLPDLHSNPSVDGRSPLIDALIEDLTPVRVARSWGSAVLLWAGISWVFVTSAVLMSGPVRSGAVAALVASPRSGLKLCLGLATGFTAIWAGLEIGVPGTPNTRRLWIPPLILFSGWLGLIAYGVAHPLFEVSMLGRREHCLAQSLVLATPPYLLALWLLRERIITAHAGAGLLVGAAAAAIPALWMQLGCLYDPVHALKFHLTPILIVGLAGALIGHFAWRD